MTAEELQKETQVVLAVDAGFFDTTGYWTF